MKIAVVGCSHGELDRMYETLESINRQNGTKIELLICCGDFQATRNEADLLCMAVPKKYHNMGSFYKYYAGLKDVPILTIFVGGNHEASNFLQELPYGGWVAPKIYYLGYAGVINVGSLRIGGISGIFKGMDYMRGRYEKTPYDNGSVRSVYHTRNVDVFRLKQLSDSLDIVLSHDWPRRIYHFGPVNSLLKHKPFFQNDIDNDNLGSKPNEELLHHLKPKHWFAAHLHTRFTATVPHDSEDEENRRFTNFLALNKCLPGRQWFEIIDIPTTDDSLELSYDLEWLTILYLTDHLTSTERAPQVMPDSKCGQRWCFTPTVEEKQFVQRKMHEDLRIPENFTKTAVSYNGYRLNRRCQPPLPVANPQTVDFCRKLGITDPLSKLVELSAYVDDPLSSDRTSPNFSRTRDPFIHSSTPNKPNYSLTPDRYNRSSTSGGSDLSAFNNSSYWSFNSSHGSDGNSSSYSDRLSFSHDQQSIQCSETITKKAKMSFPSFKPKDEATDDDGELLFCIDRTGTGSPKTSTTQPGLSSKPVFKGRNSSMYSESH